MNAVESKAADAFIQDDIQNRPISGITTGLYPLSDLLRTFTVAVSSGDITGTSDTGEAITGRMRPELHRI